MLRTSLNRRYKALHFLHLFPVLSLSASNGHEGESHFSAEVRLHSLEQNSSSDLLLPPLYSPNQSIWLANQMSLAPSTKKLFPMKQLHPNWFQSLLSSNKTACRTTAHLHKELKLFRKKGFCPNPISLLHFLSVSPQTKIR